MFGFSLQKLIFTGLAIAAVVYGFRWLAAMQERQNQNINKKKNSANAPRERARNTSSPADDAETMIECKTCGSYVAASGARSCGKDGCPYPG